MEGKRYTQGKLPSITSRIEEGGELDFSEIIIL